MTDIDSILRERLAQRESKQLYRHRLTIDSAQDSKVMLDGRSMLAFCSNDYLGLANHPEVIGAMQQAATDYGVGSGASHLVCGHSVLHQQLEEKLAEFTNRPRALLFSSGYMSNIGAVNALISRGYFIYEDKLNHASLLDAGLLSGARFQRYHHGGSADLHKRLAKAEGGNKLVVVDGVFSMDGDIADLPALHDVCQQHNTWLMVDDAHGMGVLGKSGAGSVEHWGLGLNEVPILMGTLGKSFGVSGAFVAGSEALIESLIQYARTYIYTTAIPPALAGAALCSLALIQKDSWRREQLIELVGYFREKACAIGLELPLSDTPIQPVILGSAEKTLAVSEGLKERGILVGAIRPPTVPEGKARLRITFTVNHTKADIDILVDALDELLG